MPISLAKKKAAPAPSSSGGGSGDGSGGTTGAPLGFLAVLLAAGAFVAQMYAPAQYSALSFQVLAGLAGLIGAFGMLGAVKGLRAGPKGAAALGLLLSIGALGAVAYGFTRPPAPAPAPPPETPGPGGAPAVTGTDTNAPSGTNVVAIPATAPATTNNAADEIISAPIKVQRLLPATTRTNLLRARTGKLPEPPPPPKPVAKVVPTPSTPAPPKTTHGVASAEPKADPEFPELAALAPQIELPPPTNDSHSKPKQGHGDTPPSSHPNTFRGATLATFEEINRAAKDFEAVNNLDIAALLDVSSMSSPQVIATRYRKIAAWLQQQAAFKSTIERADDVYEKRLCHAKTDDDLLTSTLAKFRETREQLYTKTLAQTEAVGRVHVAAADVLKVLGDNFSNWEYRSESKKLFFDNQEIAARYRAAVEKVQQASAKLPGS